MSSYKILTSKFSSDNLEKVYYEKVRNKAIAGLDRINREKFESDLFNNLTIINYKVISTKYKFTRYKKVLVSKGENKNPRVLNIPTIRDKLVLSTLNECLNEIYNKENCSLLPHVIIDEINEAIKSNNFDYFIKYDIESFYNNINHDILLKKIHKKIRSNQMYNLIKNAIKTNGIEYPIQKKNKKIERIKGIPEGLNISNSLANIYMLNLDALMKNNKKIKYFRYIDDILILCKKEDLTDIEKIINKAIKKLKLNFNDKSAKGKIGIDNFNYLGYSFRKNCITVREKSKYKIENSIEKLLTKHKYSKDKNIELLIWRLNLKITGCIYKNKKYGWLFFFSQIDDLVLLSQLDCLVIKLLQRYNITAITKKFKRTYYEIRKNLHNNNYIPNFDEYTITDKRKVLESVYNIDLNGMSDKKVEDEFEKVVFQDISLLEKDIQEFS